MAHILVVDDEEIIRFLLRKVLELAGHQVSEAQNGRAALDMLDRYPRLFHIILLDLQMPDMNGLEFLSNLHKEITYPPIIVLTAHGGLMQKALTYQVSGHLPKPFRRQDLIDMVNSQLNVHSGQR